MISVAEHASEAGTYQANAMKTASILHCSEYAVRQNAQAEKSAFLDSIVGRRGSLRPILSQVEAVAPTNTTVMITGETGTGKEVIARAIHELSPRRNQRLVKVNCAAMPAGLLESELFGHERGAFTGAVNSHVGRFALADRGTLFLDEIGDMPLELQPSCFACGRNGNSKPWVALALRASTSVLSRRPTETCGNGP